MEWHFGFWTLFRCCFKRNLMWVCLKKRDTHRLSQLNRENYLKDWFSGYPIFRQTHDSLWIWKHIPKGHGNFGVDPPPGDAKLVWNLCLGFTTSPGATDLWLISSGNHGWLSIFPLNGLFLGQSSSQMGNTSATLRTNTGWWFGTCFFPFSWEFNHPNWRSHTFQRGRRKATNQNDNINITDYYYRLL